MSGDGPAPVAGDHTATETDGAAERLDLLAARTEAKRLARAVKEQNRVHLVVDGPDLWIGAVSNYNVVVDVSTRRIQHGCRDFLSQGREGMLCKHVAAFLLAIEESAALSILRGLADRDGGWHVEVISARGFGRPE